MLWTKRMLGLSLGVLVLFALTGAVRVSARAEAGKVVGNGKPASCTEAALNTAMTGGGNITFRCGAAVKTIVLTASKIINADTTLDGGKKIILSAPNKFHFWITTGHTLTLKKLTVADANPGDGGAIANFGTLIAGGVTFRDNIGGAIANFNGTLTIGSSRFEHNPGFAYGGAIRSTGGLVSVKKTKFLLNSAVSAGGAVAIEGGTANITSSFFQGNQVTGSNAKGGAIFSKGTLILTKSMVDGNQSKSYGGGIHVEGNSLAQITASTISNNDAVDERGGGIFLDQSEVQLTNSTVSGNYGGWIGGGIYLQDGKLTARFVTIANNHGGHDGNGIDSAGGSVSLVNTILAGNQLNCYGSDLPTSLGYNLADDTSCGLTATGDIQGKPARLGALAKNGGPTVTHMLLSGSPAINHGKSIGIDVDQRGIARPLGAKPDMGAVEAK